MKLTIYKDYITITDFEPVEDHNFLRYLKPSFDTISFYGVRSGLEMELKLTELKDD